MPKYSPYRQSSNSLPLIAGVVFLLVGGVSVAAYFATRNTEASKEPQSKSDPAPKVETKSEKPEPKSNPQPPAKLPIDRPKPVDDTAWKSEAKDEYRDAFKNKERRIANVKRQLGMLSEGEFINATRCLKLLESNGIEKAPPAIIEAAAKIAPHYVEMARREQQLKSGEYGKLVEKGLRPQRHPADKRKKMYAEFARAVGAEPDWSLTVPFDNLTAEEMDDALSAVERLTAGGLGKLTKPQRLLLLKAEALELFQRELGL